MKININGIDYEVIDVKEKMTVPELEGRKITVSAGGYISNNIKKDNILEMIGQADENLYKSKKTGKNKITI